MNYIKEVVEKVLPVEIGEEFNIILDNGEYYMHNPVKFSETDLVDTFGGVFTNYIGRIITGEYKIEKIPFKPKMGEKYFSYGAGLERPYIDQLVWANICYDRERKVLGIIFKTKQEAMDYLPTWQKRLEGEKL